MGCTVQCTLYMHTRPCLQQACAKRSADLYNMFALLSGAALHASASFAITNKQKGRIHFFVFVSRYKLHKSSVDLLCSPIHLSGLPGSHNQLLGCLPTPSPVCSTNRALVAKLFASSTTHSSACLTPCFHTIHVQLMPLVLARQHQSRQ